MKKVVYLSISIIFVMIAAVFLFRDYIGLVFVSYFLEPKHNFVEKPVPAAPVYQNQDHWAALPERQDFADVRVDSLSTGGQKEAAVDVFFVHPTTYIGRDSWNQRIDDSRVNDLTDSWVMRDQASVFNECCRVFAPRYRQATLYSCLLYTSPSPRDS